MTAAKCRNFYLRMFVDLLKLFKFISNLNKDRQAHSHCILRFSIEESPGNVNFPLKMMLYLIQETLKT